MGENGGYSGLHEGETVAFPRVEIRAAEDEDDKFGLPRNWPVFQRAFFAIGGIIQRRERGIEKYPWNTKAWI